MKRARRPVTITQIAELADTLASTVSRVLSNDPRISKATRTRVLEVLKKQNYKPNLFARVLKGGRTGQIGVLSTNIGGSFFGDILQGIDAVTRARGVHMTCTFAHGIDDFIAIADDLLTGGRVDGLIMIDPPLQLFDHPLPPGAAPATLCASRPLKARSPWHRIESATLDNRDAMARLIFHLTEKGCREFLHLAGPDNTYDGTVRRAAFQSVAKRQRGVRWGILDGHLIESDGRRSAEKIVRGETSVPDAILCFNDSTAHGLVRSLEAAGFDWKGRIAITGWDDSVVATLIDLTSVVMPTHELGQKAAELLLKRIATEAEDDEPRHAVLPASLSFRASTEVRTSHEPEAE